MTAKKTVLIIGLEPTLIDFSSPDFAAFPGMNAARVMGGLQAGQASLGDVGYETELCLTDFGATAESVVTTRLLAKHYDCILIGAGVRSAPSQFLLFEKLINVVHQHAPQSKICFNTKPDDTAVAVQRWV